MPEPKRHIVRPFGLIGDAYEVDRVGLFKYLLACVIAAVVVGVAAFGSHIGVPPWLAIAITLAGIVGTILLCADVARKGRKL